MSRDGSHITGIVMFACDRLTTFCRWTFLLLISLSLHRPQQPDFLIASLSLSLSLSLSISASVVSWLHAVCSPFLLIRSRRHWAVESSQCGSHAPVGITLPLRTVHRAACDVTTMSSNAAARPITSAGSAELTNGH